MPAALANQIAAGEVVERPASCVKELIENSLDAGAKAIQVSLVDGGIASIVVQDDGCGMDEADAKLAFSRHATSKLIHSRDLFRIATLGFRGEALASIAAVAKVSLQTRRPEATRGIQMIVEGTDKVDGPSIVGMPPGTRIEVQELFFNTPARLKYLRTVQTEQARSVEVVQRAALARPDVAFRCETGGHLLFQTPGRNDVRDVLSILYGVGEARQLIPFETSSPDYKIYGFLGRPTQSKSTRSHGHIFVNHRPIRNLAVHQAIVAGYQARLMVNRHPLYAVFIEMDPTLVDVNIHPHKAEVRFSEERDLCLLMQQAVKRALDEVLLVPSFQFGEPTADKRSEQQALSLQTSMPGRNENVRFDRNAIVRELPENPRSTSQQKHNRNDWSLPHANPASVEQRKLAVKDAAPAEAIHAVLANAPESPEARQERRPANWQLRPVGQALGMYIIADDGDALYIIDQHAAHERVLFEKFQKRMRQREICVIPLLTPLSRTLGPVEHALVMSNLDAFREMGLQFEPFGGLDVLLRTVPDVWEGLDADKLLDEVLAQLPARGTLKDVKDVLRDLIVMRACKAAIKANWYLSAMEMEALCQSLSELEDPFHCPHGRPV